MMKNTFWSVRAESRQIIQANCIAKDMVPLAFSSMPTKSTHIKSTNLSRRIERFMTIGTWVVRAPRNFVPKTAGLHLLCIDFMQELALIPFVATRQSPVLTDHGLKVLAFVSGDRGNE
jgi:hypothetical protein